MNSPLCTCALLALPDALLREVNSWCPDSRTAASLHNTCRAAHKLRHDAGASALLLLRCRCACYNAALRIYGHERVDALLRHLLQLLHAGPDAGGPHTALAPLLQGMLNAACSSGLPDSVDALMALRQPPNVDAGAGRAMIGALYAGQVDALRALLNHGADPCAPPMHQSFLLATELPDPSGPLAMRLLVQHCPPAHAAAAKGIALLAAATSDRLEMAAMLLPMGDGRLWMAVSGAYHATRNDSVAMLQLIMEHHPPDAMYLGLYLLAACTYCSPDTAAFLLDRGADLTFVNHGVDLLGCALGLSPYIITAPHPEWKRFAMVRLLLQRGAVVTQAARNAAAALGMASLVSLLAHVGDV